MKVCFLVCTCFLKCRVLIKMQTCPDMHPLLVKPNIQMTQTPLGNYHVSSADCTCLLQWASFILLWIHLGSSTASKSTRQNDLSPKSDWTKIKRPSNWHKCQSVTAPALRQQPQSQQGHRLKRTARASRSILWPRFQRGSIKLCVWVRKTVCWLALCVMYVVCTAGQVCECKCVICGTCDLWASVSSLL